ncbi:MAG: hypothetical protein AUK48_05585 [Oscillatoriales cyanobacterium CG2_30_44_21]|nr:MAG: hypothetical protein AUK48_05585 [Oscillatoriales cyanobacterium CG2_30_44_21]
MQLQLSKVSALSQSLKYSPVRYLALFSLGLLFYGCGENRVVQCNKLVTIANKASAMPIPTDDAGFNQFADSLSQIRAEVQEISVQDATLKGLQTQLLAVYDTTVLSLKTRVKAKETKNREAVSQSMQVLETTASQEEEIVDQINNLCKG